MENWTIENFVLVGQVTTKLVGIWWPVLLAAGIFAVIEWRKECA
jgi:hypothetical protein